ncbi:MAG: AAA family ATPase [Candidatus Bathyarchaeota archaeon]|nr:AAA family ATPase [Candidatus Bathyarchaeota archaeon]
MERVLTGITGFDEMLTGGLPESRISLLCGGPGSGKTIFSLQYIMSAIDRGEPCVYVSLEESFKDKVENAYEFSWDIPKAIEDNLMGVLDICMIPQSKGYVEPFERTRGKLELGIVKEIEDLADSIKAKHIVIDPLTSIVIHEVRSGRKRYLIGQIFDSIRRKKCSGVITSEGLPSRNDFYMEQFLADGVIFLEKRITDFKLVKTLRVDKMRGISFDEQPRRYLITNRGFSVFNKEPVIT